MTSFQRTIKYIAMAFGIMLAIGIISTIAKVGISVLGITTNIDTKKTKDFTQSFEDVKELNIENVAGSLTIKPGENFEVVAKNVSEDFIAEVDSNGTLRIKDKFSISHFFRENNRGFSSDITLTIPKDFIADSVTIDCGIGNVSIQDLTSRDLEINAGAGDISGTNLKSDKVYIDGGAGNVNLSEVYFQNVTIDSGVGNTDLEGELLGNNDIDGGVGDVYLRLKGTSDMYNHLSIDSGLGDITVDGKQYSNLNWNNDTADGSLTIDGGVGDIEIDFE